jgi:hypothetical protein
MLDLKKIERYDDIEIQYKICEKELEESLQFIEDPDLILDNLS